MHFLIRRIPWEGCNQGSRDIQHQRGRNRACWVVVVLDVNSATFTSLTGVGLVLEVESAHLHGAELWTSPTE